MHVLLLLSVILTIGKYACRCNVCIVVVVISNINNIVQLSYRWRNDVQLMPVINWTVFTQKLFAVLPIAERGRLFAGMFTACLRQLHEYYEAAAALDHHHNVFEAAANGTYIHSYLLCTVLSFIHCMLFVDDAIHEEIEVCWRRLGCHASPSSFVLFSFISIKSIMYNTSELSLFSLKII